VCKLALSREALLKRKAQYGWPPWLLYTLKILLNFLIKQASLIRRSTVLSPPLQLGFPALRFVFFLNTTWLKEVIKFNWGRMSAARSAKFSQIFPQIFGLIGTLKLREKLDKLKLDFSLGSMLQNEYLNIIS
jgi:hypothetical protein